MNITLLSESKFNMSKLFVHGGQGSKRLESNKGDDYWLVSGFKDSKQWI